MSFLYFSILTSENIEYGIIGKIICIFLAFVLHFLVTIVFVSSDCDSSYEQTFFKLSKRVSTRLEQIDSSIIDTTLEERTKIAEWFVEENGLVGIRKDSNNSYTVFYSKSNNIDEEEKALELVERNNLTKNIKKNIQSKMKFDKLTVSELKQLNKLVEKVLVKKRL